jgi:hypothetical protein
METKLTTIFIDKGDKEIQKKTSEVFVANFRKLSID